MVVDQADYHTSTAHGNERIAHRLHSINFVLLLGILIACWAHITSRFHDLASVWATIAAAVLPAIGAALAGLLSQSEFERIAQRSDGMSKLLKEIAADIRSGQAVSSQALIILANDAIDVMSQELSDWRVIFRTKPLEMHA